MRAHPIAIHEAGHVWAYRCHELPLRYVTIRPRSRLNGKRIDGICRTWKPRRIDGYVQAFIASAGPIAEAMYMHERHRHINDHRENDPFGEDYDFDDYLTGAVLDGGDGDLGMALGLLSSPGIVEVIRQDLQRDWSGIEALAGRLVAEGTVSGRDAFATIADCLRTVDRS